MKRFKRNCCGCNKEFCGYTPVCCNCRVWYAKYIKKLNAIKNAGGKCCICECDDVECLQFHHKDSSTKEFTISDHYKTSINIDKEISKCDLVCANCHSKLHATYRKKVVEFYNGTYDDTDLLYKKFVEKEKDKKCGLKKKYKPSKEELEKLIWEKPAMVLAKEFGYDNSSIGLWCKKYGIQKPYPGYWTKVNGPNKTSNSTKIKKEALVLFWKSKLNDNLISEESFRTQIERLDNMTINQIRKQYKTKIDFPKKFYVNRYNK